MPIATALTKRLDLTHPIIQAPMAGGGDTPRLVAAVSEAGGLGSIGVAYLTPQQIGETASTVRGLTPRPFDINLFAPVKLPENGRDPRAAVQRVTPMFAEVGLPGPTAPTRPPDAFADQLAAACETGAAIFSFTFGMLSPDAIATVKRRGMLVAGTATTVDE